MSLVEFLRKLKCLTYCCQGHSHVDRSGEIVYGISRVFAEFVANLSGSFANKYDVTFVAGDAVADA